MDTLHVAKHQGLGNDFLVALLSDREQADLERRVGDLAGLARETCDRRKGIGADGLILATGINPTQPSLAPDADESASATPARRVAMRLYNSDGSSAEVSGNGLACLANEVARTFVAGMEFGGRTEARGDILVLTVDTADGARRVTLSAEFAAAGNGSVEPIDPLAEVHMPHVGRGPDISAALDEQIRRALGSVQRETGDVGNPHLVINAGRPVNAHDTADLGAAFEAHFPRGINVEFIWRIERENSDSADSSSIGMSVWERGAGLTQACGTGAVTAAVRAQNWGLVSPSAETLVEMPGGKATVSTDEVDGHPILSVWVEYLGNHVWPLDAPSLDA